MRNEYDKQPLLGQPKAEWSELGQRKSSMEQWSKEPWAESPLEEAMLSVILLVATLPPVQEASRSC